jgi:hypothetical protein
MRQRTKRAAQLVKMTKQELATLVLDLEEEKSLAQLLLNTIVKILKSYYEAKISEDETIYKITSGLDLDKEY